MSRSSPANFANDSVNLFVAVELEFDSGAVRLWNGYHDATIDGDEYTGAGSFMSVGTIEESGEVSAKGTTIALSGIDASLISLALQENYQNRTARVIIGTVDSGVFTDYTLFRGRMDVIMLLVCCCSVASMLSCKTLDATYSPNIPFKISTI